MRHRHIRAALVPSMIAGLAITAAPMAVAEHDVAADLEDGAPVTLHLNDSGYGGSFDLDFDVAYSGVADGREVYVLAPVGWQTSGAEGAQVPGINQGWDPTAGFDADDGDTDGDGSDDDVTPCVDGDEHVMTQEQIDSLGDSVANIVAVDEAHFGEVQGDAPIVVLAYNVLDEAFYDCTYPSYTAGYFAPDLLAEAGLNTIVIDSYQWSQRLELYKGTIAHELEHLLMNYSDPGELSWIDEGLADFAQYLTGYGADIGHTYYHQVFHRETSLTLWGGGLQDYGASYTFMQYAWEQAGGHLVDGELTTDVPVGDFTKEYTGVAGDLFIKTLFHEQANGIEGVQNAIDTYNQAVEAGTVGNLLPDVNTLIANWAIAIDEDVEASELFDLAAIDTQTELSGLTIDYGNEVFYDGRGVYEGNANETRFEKKKDVPEQTALPYSLSYETFRNAGQTVSFDFAAPATTQIADTDDEGDRHWYAGYASQTDSVLAFDYAGQETLEFSTWYFIEEGWDYAFVEALVDGAWVTVPVVDAAGETITTNTDPHGNNEEGNGLTGTSGGAYFVDDPTYIEASATLPAGTTDVRIRYSTDAAYLDTGIFVDDTNIAVDPAGEPGETDAQTATWVETDGSQQNDFLLQLVSPCDLTPDVEGDETLHDEGSGLYVWRFEGTQLSGDGFDTQCLGGQDRFTVIITNRPTGDLAFLTTEYDFVLEGTGRAEAKGHDQDEGA